jgi:hypothetical protein
MSFLLERILQLGTACFLLWASAGQSSMVAPLQASLEPKQSECVLGVPTEFTASISNVSSVPVETTDCALRPYCAMMIPLISEDGSTFREFRGPEWDLGKTMDLVPGKITLKPGTKVQGSFILLWDRPTDASKHAPTDDFAFPHVGTYFVKIKVASNLGELMSNVVRVVVRQPRGDDAAIWEALKADKGLARYYGFPDGTPGEGEKLQQLLNKYPNSSHVASMKKALAVYARQQAEIDAAKKARGASRP